MGRIFCVAVVLAVLGAVDAAWPPPYSWEKLSVWAFPGRMPGPHGFLNESQLEHFARFAMVDMSGFNLTCVHGKASGAPVECPPPRHTNWVGNQETALPYQAQQLLRVNPRALVAPYVYWGCSQDWHASGKEFDLHPEWWVNASDAQPVLCMDWGYGFDFTQPAVVQFFVEKVVAPFVSPPSTAGVFFDEYLMMPFYRCPNSNCSASYQTDLAEATLQALEVVCQYMAERGKVAIVSTNPRHVPPDYFARYVDIMAKHKMMHYYEFFCAWLGHGCLRDVLSMMEYVKKGIAIQAHSPFSPGEGMGFKLGAFLLAAGEHTYFAWGKGADWTSDAWPWMPEFDKPLGAPRGEATNVSDVWRRSFAHADVVVDFSKSVGNITWH